MHEAELGNGGYQKVGTPFFAAPEVWEEKELSKKSDIWSLGVLLYEICTFKLPFTAPSIELLAPKVLKEKPAALP